jgi:hypothetical protein
MKKLVMVLLVGFAATASAAPLKVGIVGLVHGHVAAFLGGGAMTPAGGILSRPDVEVVGIVEPDQALFDSYAKRYRLPASLHFKSIAEMAAQAHPQAVLVFTPPSEHRQVVVEGAPLVAPYDDPLHYLEAVLDGTVEEGTARLHCIRMWWLRRFWTRLGSLHRLAELLPYRWSDRAGWKEARRTTT